MIIDIHLGKSAELTLSYQMYDNSVSSLFYERMKQQENLIVDRSQFYNFGETEEEIQQKLSAVSQQLLTAGLISDVNQDNLNQLHENFPRLHAETTNLEHKALLQKFNYLIHHLEDLSRKFNSKRFLFTCEDDGIDLPKEAYSMFTPSKKFGVMYMNYPHVGKHFLELFADNDVHIPNDQIQFTTKMSNTVYCWLDNDKYTTQFELDDLMMMMFMFYRQIQNKIPYQWKDPRLTIGYLPLGELVTKDIDISNIAVHKYVHSWTCR